MLHTSGLSRIKTILDGSSGYPVVLAYHRVVPDYSSAAQGSIPGMVVSTRTFEDQLDWLARNYDILSLESINQREPRNKTKRPALAITFDDGYKDNFENAFPILMRKGISAAIFVTTGLINSQQPPIHDRLYHLVQLGFAKWRGKRYGAEQLFCRGGITIESFRQHSANLTDPFGAVGLLLSTLPQAHISWIVEALESSLSESARVMDSFKPLTWEMISEMASAGISIGSHTQTHVLLANENLERVVQEIVGSRRELEARLGRPVHHFAYPVGCFNHQTVQAVASAGYRYGYTTCGHRHPEFPELTIPRRTIYEASSRGANGRFSPAVMSCHLNGVLKFLGDACTQDHGFPQHRKSARAKPKKIGCVQ